MRSLVISVLLYACETWTLTADILKKLQATELRCFRKLLGISYRDHVTNDAVRERIRQAIRPYDDILTTVKKCKLKWFGHVLRSVHYYKAFGWVTLTEVLENGHFGDSIFYLIKGIFLFVSPIPFSFLVC